MNNISGAVKALSPLNRSFGSNNAANAIGGRFLSGMNAGTTPEWPEGIEIVSWDTTRKTLLEGISNFLWYRGTEAESHINSFFFENMGSHWRSSRKSRPIRLSDSDLTNTWKVWSNTFSAICTGRWTVPRVSMGNWFAAFNCVVEGDNFKGILDCKESNIALLRQDTLAPLSHTASMMRSITWILTKMLRWSTTAFNSCGWMSLLVSLSALRPVSVDDFSLNDCSGCFGIQFWNAQLGRTWSRPYNLGNRDYFVYSVCMVPCYCCFWSFLAIQVSVLYVVFCVDFSYSEYYSPGNAQLYCHGTQHYLSRSSLSCRYSSPDFPLWGNALFSFSVRVRTNVSIKSLVCNSEEVRETRFTAGSGATVDVEGAPFSNSRKEFSSIAMVRASSAAAGLLFLSCQWRVESFNPSMKLVRTICSMRWGKAR